MNYLRKNITDTEKRRFNYSDKKCCLCGNEIFDASQLGYFKTRSGKRVNYNFFHKHCAELTDVISNTIIKSRRVNNDKS